MLHHPEIVSWNITSSCNLHCAHCYLDAGATKTNELSTEECYRVIDQMAELGTEMVILTGGEPMLRTDLLAIIGHAREKGIMPVMGSNGTLIDEDVAASLKEAGLQGVGISLDSIQPKKHDSFRGLSGCWETAVKGMNACLKQGLPVIIQTTLTPWNYGEIPALIDFAQNQGATAFNLYYLVCTGRGEKLTDVSPQQYEESLASLVDAQALHLSMMIRAKCAPQIARISAQHGLPQAGGGCPAGVSYLRIGPEGQVTPCPYLPLVAGNVRESPLKDIWESADILTQLRNPGLGGRCGVCSYRKTCTGCRARALAMTGSYLEEDPWCLFQSSAPLPTSQAQLTWTQEAQVMLQRVPAFVRTRVKAAVEGYAGKNGHSLITAELMAEVRNSIGGGVRRAH